MNFFYVIFDNIVFPCKTMREAKEVANIKREFYPNADIIICKAIYSELKVKVENIDF